MRKRRKAYITWSIVCLISGLMPYVLLRQNVLFLGPVRWLLPSPLSPTGTPLCTFFVNHFSDFAWYMSLLLFMASFPQQDKTDRMMFVIGAALPFLLETAQGLRLISGTFDTLDLLTYTITLTLYFTMKKSLTMKKLLKNRKTMLQCAGLLAFAGMALACSSQDAASFKEGYHTIGDIYMGPVTQNSSDVEMTPNDSIVNVKPNISSFTD